MHCHSLRSDGALSPQALVELAAEQGVSHLALTDHDTLAGVAEARQAALTTGIDLINGVEFSCQWQNRGIHVVGLNFDLTDSALLAAIGRMATIRQQRSEQIAERLGKLGFPGCLQGAQRYANGAVVGRPHFAQYLIELGVVKDFNQAFKRYLGNGKAGDVRHQWPELAEVVGWIVAAGGVAVIAHPLKYDLTRTKLVALLSSFLEAGGKALEVISGSDQSPDQTRNLAALAGKMGLYASVGSDFHSPGMPWQMLGRTGQLPDTIAPVWQCWS